MSWVFSSHICDVSVCVCLYDVSTVQLCTYTSCYKQILTSLRWIWFLRSFIFYGVCFGVHHNGTCIFVCITMEPACVWCVCMCACVCTSSCVCTCGYVWYMCMYVHCMHVSAYFLSFGVSNCDLQLWCVCVHTRACACTCARACVCVCVWWKRKTKTENGNSQNLIQIMLG